MKTMKTSLCVLALGFVAACFSANVDSSIGNEVNNNCSGDECSCDRTGNCSFMCPGGGCTFDCANTGNCFAQCSDNCTMTCAGTGNCSLQCEGPNCAITSCAVQGNCVCQDSDGSCL